MHAVCVLAAFLLVLSTPVSSSSCHEKNWCPNSPSTKRQENGDENERCGKWARDCPCTCAKALVELEAREREEEIRKAREIAEIQKRDTDILNHFMQHRDASARRQLSESSDNDNGSNDDDNNNDNDNDDNAKVTLSIFVRTQNVPSDLPRVEYFRAFQERFPESVEFVFAHELEEVSEHREKPDSSQWAVTPFVKPWFQRESSVAGGKPHWFLVMEPWTLIDDFEELRHFLSYFDSSKQHFLGHGFTMKTGVLTLQHEFRDLQAAWPDAGFALSRGVVQRLAAIDDIVKPQNFFVTWEREFAFAVRKHVGTSLLSLPKYFCDSFDQEADKEHCVLTAANKYDFRVSHGVSYGDIIIAVKTTVSYHAQRLDILTHTWAQNTTHPVEIIFASDGPDPRYHPVVDLVAEWGPQVDQKKGHCAKAYAIMQHFLKHYPNKKVFVIADDDSMIHVPNLLKMVDAYDWNKDLYLGQRYGYGFSGKSLKTGYAYITMGGGLCISKSFMQSIVDDPSYSCSAPDTPDDMQFGRWARRMGLTVTHDDGFHQAQMENYGDIVKRSQRVVSYHKFDKEMDRETQSWHVTTPLNVDKYYNQFPDLADQKPLAVGTDKDEALPGHDGSEL